MPVVPFLSEEKARAGEKAALAILTADPRIEEPTRFVERLPDKTGATKIVAIHLEPGSERTRNVIDALRKLPDYSPATVLSTAAIVLNRRWQRNTPVEELPLEDYRLENVWSSLRTAWTMLSFEIEDDITLIPGYQSLQDTLNEIEKNHREGLPNPSSHIATRNAATETLEQLAHRLTLEDEQAGTRTTTVQDKDLATLRAVRKNLSRALNPPNASDYSGTALYDAADQMNTTVKYFLKQYPPGDAPKTKTGSAANESDQ